MFVLLFLEAFGGGMLPYGSTVQQQKYAYLIFIFDTAEAEVHIPSGALNSDNLLAARACACSFCKTDFSTFKLVYSDFHAKSIPLSDRNMTQLL